MPDSEARYVSLSHTRTAAVAAIGPAAIGVDVESVHRRVDWPRIAAACFSADEQAWLDRHAPDQRKTAFLVLWTCKEAWLKAQGLGLSHLNKALFEPLERSAFELSHTTIGRHETDPTCDLNSSFPRRREPSAFTSATQKRHWTTEAVPGDPCWQVPGNGWHAETRLLDDGLVISVLWQAPAPPRWMLHQPDRAVGTLEPATACQRRWYGASREHALTQPSGGRSGWY